MKVIKNADPHLYAICDMLDPSRVLMAQSFNNKQLPMAFESGKKALIFFAENFGDKGLPMVRTLREFGLAYTDCVLVTEK